MILPNGTSGCTPDQVSKASSRDDATGGAKALRQQVARALAEEEAAKNKREQLERKLAAITDAKVDTDASVAARIRAFYYQNHSMSFSAGEIADAVHASVETVRKTLQRMTERNEIAHTGYGAYGVTDDFFELNGWDKERLNRNWED